MTADESVAKERARNEITERLRKMKAEWASVCERAASYDMEVLAEMGPPMSYINRRLSRRDLNFTLREETSL